MNLSYWTERIKLEGSDAQIKWAKQIRLKRVGELQKMGTRTLLLGIKPHVTDADMKAMGNMTEKNILSFARGVAQHMLSCPKASWWIAHRDDPLHSWIKPSVQACVAHYSKHQSFK